MTFFFPWEILFFPTQRKWSMAFNIFFLSYTWQSVGFLFHVWVFFYPCVLEFSLNDCTQGSWTLTPCVCLWTQAGHCDLPVQNGGYCIFSSLLSLGVATLLPFKNTFTQPKHAHNRHLSPPNGSVLTTLVTFLVLNHLSLPLLFHMTYMFLVSISSTLEDFRNVGWDSFTKCTLYVFQSLWEDPGALISVPI